MTPNQLFASAYAAMKEELRTELLDELRAELGAKPDRTLDIRQAAEHLGLSENLLREMCRKKRIKHIPAGAESSRRPHYLFRLSSLDAWQREQEDANYRSS